MGAPIDHPKAKRAMTKPRDKAYEALLSEFRRGLPDYVHKRLDAWNPEPPNAGDPVAYPLAQVNELLDRLDHYRLRLATSPHDRSFLEAAAGYIGWTTQHMIDQRRARQASLDWVSLAIDSIRREGFIVPMGRNGFPVAESKKKVG